MESGTDSTNRRPRYWTIFREGSSRLEVFTVDLDGLGEAFAVFGFEEEAEMFLGLEEMGGGWQVRETTAGELVSMLYGPCASIDRVLIDPLPRCIVGRTRMPLLSVRSTDFARTMVNGGDRTAAGAMPALAALRP